MCLRWPQAAGFAGIMAWSISSGRPENRGLPITVSRGQHSDVLSNIWRNNTMRLQRSEQRQRGRHRALVAARPDRQGASRPGTALFDPPINVERIACRQFTMFCRLLLEELQHTIQRIDLNHTHCRESLASCMPLQTDDQIRQCFANEPARTVSRRQRLPRTRKCLVNFSAAPNEAAGCIGNPAQFRNFKHCKFAENAIGHERLVAIGCVLEVPEQRVGCGEPI